MSYTSPDVDVAQYIRLQVAAGFHSLDTIAEYAVDIHGGDPEKVEQMVAEEAAAKAAASASWPEITDCDRIDRAFASLDASGVLARQNFACCNNCGHYEMADLVHDERETDRPLDGYAFYHWQDTDAAVAGGPLHIRFGSMSSATEAKAAIGRRVVEALRAQGLAAEWNGDPEVTIQLPSFDWKRREPPVIEEAVWTGSAAVERWCEQLPLAMAAELSGALGVEYAEAAVSAGCIDAALAVARSAPRRTRIGHSCSGALARVALAATRARKPPLSSDAITNLWLEAFKVAPYGRTGALVDLLIVADLKDPVIMAAAYDRISQTRRDIFGAASVAWGLLRAPSTSADEGRELTLDSIQRLFESDPGYELHADEARAAVAAALWVLRSRRGETNKAAAALEVALAQAREYVEGVSDLFAQRAVIAAATMLSQLGEVARELTELSCDTIWFELIAALASSGELDVAVELIEQRHRPAWLLAQLCRSAPEDPRVAEWINQAEETERELDTLFDEGLLTEAEARDTRLQLAALRAERGDEARARVEISEVGVMCREEVSATGAEMHSYLEVVRDGARGSALPTRHLFLATAAADDERELEEALGKWDAGAPEGGRRLRLRRFGRKILSAAAAIAHRGDIARARSLIERVRRAEHYEFLSFALREQLVAAWVATDQLDQALSTVEAHVAGSDTVPPIAVRLVELDRASEALELLGPLLDRPLTLEELLALTPAVLAVSPDRQGAAAAMLEAWRGCDTALDPMIVL